MDLFVIPATAYNWLYNCSLGLLAVCCIPLLTGKNAAAIVSPQKNSTWVMLIIAIIYILWLGLRPINIAFGDTPVYANQYHLYTQTGQVNEEHEYLWTAIMAFIADLKLSVNVWFLSIELCYIGFTAYACKRIFGNNSFWGFIFVITCFSFFSYGVNGIRNGLACSLTLFGMTFVKSGKRNFIIPVIIFIIASQIHKTTILPSCCWLFSKYIDRKTTTAMWVWAAAIVISLFLGESVKDFILSFSFDKRLQGYVNLASSNVMDKFSHAGFRWDFLLYSATPILIGYYALQKKQIKDRIYSVYLNTYIYANSFWVLVNTAAYSNRFAYLSWFMYGIVLAYPLLKLKLFSNQGLIIVLGLCYQLFFLFTV